MNPNFLYSNSYIDIIITIIVIIIIIISIIILIFLLPTYFSLGSNATDPIFQHLKAEFQQHTFSCEKSQILRKHCAKIPLCLLKKLFRMK